MVRKIAENYELPYYSISPTYSVCKNHGYIAGEQFTCPECGEKTEVYSRITGYYRPVQNWNDGKSQEYKDRLVYNPGKMDKKAPLSNADKVQDCECAAPIEAKKTVLLSNLVKFQTLSNVFKKFNMI